MRAFKTSLPAALWLRGAILPLTVVSVITSTVEVDAQWKKISQFTHLIPAIYFIDLPGTPRIGFLSVGGHTGDHTPFGFFSAGEVWKSTDGGQNWHRTQLLSDASEIDNFCFRDSTRGWFAARDSLPGKDDWGGCYETSDGGESWMRLNNSAGASSSVYYCRSTKMLLLSKWWGYSGPRYGAESMMISSNEGMSWSHISGLQNGNGFAFVDSVNGVATCAYGGFWRTSDGGKTWGITYPDNGERWQPVGISGSTTFMAVDEVSPALWCSTDLGSTWQQRGKLAYSPATALRTNISGMIAGDFRALLFQAIDGFEASYDTGRTWHSICGPPSTYDIRFYLKDNFVYATDSTGGLWLNTHALGRGVPTFYDAPMRIAVTGCDPVLKRFPFNYSDPCIGGAQFDSVSLSGSSAWSIDPGPTPREVSDLDSFSVTHSPTILADTAHVTFHFTFEGEHHDTTVEIFASGSASRASVVALSEPIVSSDCQAGVSHLFFSGSDTCLSATLDSVSIDTMAGFSIDTSVLPRPLSKSDSLTILYSSRNAQSKDSARITFHFTLSTGAYDTTITVYGVGIGSDNAEALQITSGNGSASISLPSGAFNELSLRSVEDVPGSSHLRSIHCTIALRSDAVSKSGPAVGMNGWDVTKEIVSGADLALEIFRSTPIDIHVGDEIARIPIRGNLALDTAIAITLTDYSFNSDFKGCAPQSIAPDTVMIFVVSQCGDSTIRHFMRSGVPFFVRHIEPNPTRDVLHVVVEQRSAEPIQYDVADVLGRSVMSGPILTGTLSTESLPNGAYWLRLSQGSYVATTRFQVRR